MPNTVLDEKQIERVITRATKFLGTLSNVPGIRVLLDLGGYEEKEHAHGWELLLELLGYRTGNPAAALMSSTQQAEAVAALDQWDGPSFDRARAALEHRFPAQAEYVFEDLAAKNGAESIGAVRTFLDRVAALRSGSDPARASTRAEDAKAAALLATRKILSESEEKRLRGLIAQATELAPVPQPAPINPERRQLVAQELAAWLRDWRETARVLVTRRDYQIRLGLAERRSRGDEDEEEEAETTPAATPATAAATTAGTTAAS
jgi:hypothetical protein